MNKLEKRDLKVDILRFIAILGIIIAHSDPNKYIFEIRNFDVTLMVLLMGTSYYLSNSEKKVNYLSHIFKRFNRLVIPTWIFLIIFFTLFYLISFSLGDMYYFSVSQIISSFMLLSGIGYVWVMRVFFIIALISPIILFLSKKIHNNIMFLLYILIGLLLQFSLLYVYSLIDGVIAKGFEYIILPSLGYTLVAAIGIRLKQLSNREIVIYILSFLCVFLLFLFMNNFQSTQLSKYPPGIYYLSYGVLCSLILYLLLDNKILFKLFNRDFVYLISKNSLWLYFWHIIPVQIIFIFGRNTIFEESFILRFMFIFSTAFAFTYTHYQVSKFIKGLK